MHYTVNEANVYWQDIILLFVEVYNLLRYNKNFWRKFCSFYVHHKVKSICIYYLQLNIFIVFNVLISCKNVMEPIYIEIIPNKFQKISKIIFFCSPFFLLS